VREVLEEELVERLLKRAEDQRATDRTHSLTSPDGVDARSANEEPSLFEGLRSYRTMRG
jgi:hypothetical protein